jgi:hypothetical protein
VCFLILRIFCLLYSFFNFTSRISIFNQIIGILGNTFNSTTSFWEYAGDPYIGPSVADCLRDVCRFSRAEFFILRDADSHQVISPFQDCHFEAITIFKTA